MSEPHLNPPAPALTPRRAAITIALTVLATVVLLPLDGPIAHVASHWMPQGDLREELEPVQKFGAAASVIIVLLVMLALDTPRVKRMLDWALAAVITSITVNSLKILIGRPRPLFNDPLTFNGPFGQYLDPTRTNDDGTPVIIGQALGFNRQELWSMPSGHTANAMVLATFLATVYPKLRPMAFTLAGVVALCRILFGAHYPTDVLVGGLIGWSIASFIIPRSLGVRAVDAVFGKRGVSADPSA